MSREVAVSVPAKTILLGEHAAVYGHPALVTAVDLRLTAVARRVGDPGVTITNGSRSAALSHGEVLEVFHGLGAPGDRLAFVAAGAALLHLDDASSGWEISIASEIPPGAGLGSSAALAVTVVAAMLHAACVAADAATIARLALAVERRQHGRPSGVDVEAVLRGGTIWCSKSEDGSLTCSEIAATADRLDTFRLFHSGAPAESTGDMVAAVARLTETAPGRVREAMDMIDGATRVAREMLTAAPPGAVGALMIPLVRRAQAALESLGVVPDGVAAAIRTIEAAGGAAKISGAGGRAAGAGLVLVVSPDPSVPASSLVPASWTPVTAALGASGLREEVAA